MTSIQKKRAYFILALLVLSLVVIAPTFLRDQLPEGWPGKPIRLGLDLKGGSYLVLGVQTKEAVKSQLGNIAIAVRSEMRKNPEVRLIRASARPGNTVQFVLLDDKGVEPLEAFMRENYRELSPAGVQRGDRRVTITYRMSETTVKEVEKNAVIQAIETIRNRIDAYGVAEPTIQRAGTRRVMVQLPDVTDIEQVKKTIGSVAKLEFRLVADPSAPEDQVVRRRSREGGGELRLEDEVVMAGDAIDKASVEINPQTNEREVTLRLNSYGRTTFDRITSDNVGRQLAILLDGVVQSAPVIRERISGGTAQISGGFSPQEAHRLQIVLRSGALPAPLTFEEERIVGASLGSDSIEKGVYATALGSLVVVGFIILYYRKSGLLAIACLLANVLFLLALLSTLGATLTLPGIAGLALTIGMAVDANVLIFERIREELRVGATVKAAIEAGFDKAHWAIMDANLTTLLSGIILYGFGTGPVKGFAVTLSLGVITSMFAALYVCRVGFSLFKLRTADGSLSI